MTVTTIDQYTYSRVMFRGRLKQIRVIVENKVDPVISDIESKLIDSNQRVYLEGDYYTATNTFLKNIGSATALVLEVEP